MNQKAHLLTHVTVVNRRLPPFRSHSGLLALAHTILQSTGRRPLANSYDPPRL